MRSRHVKMIVFMHETHFQSVFGSHAYNTPKKKKKQRKQPGKRVLRFIITQSIQQFLHLVKLLTCIMWSDYRYRIER